MARCASSDILRQLIMEGNFQEMDSSDSDSVISCRSSEEKENTSNSLERADNSEKVNIGPVLSLQCLHEDSDEEANESSKDATESEFIGIDDVPPLLTTSAQENVNIEDNQLEEILIKKMKTFRSRNSLETTIDYREDLCDHGFLSCPQEVELHPHLVPVKTVNVNNPVQNTVHALLLNPQSSVPARANWDGLHNFKIKVKCSDIATKSDNSFFSELLHKLYVGKDNPFKVLVSAENVPIGSIIKVTAVFCLVEHSCDAVKRCPTHAQQDFSRGETTFEHFVQCFSETAVYEKNEESGKLSVSVPYEKPKDGETYTSYLFKLTCFNSCTGGINRRPFMLVFTLEKDNIPLGRQTLEAKVCACPLRDFKLDEEKERKRNGLADKTINKQISIAPCQEKNSSKYSIVVKDLELYLFLKHMKNLYETSAYSAKINPDT